MNTYEKVKESNWIEGITRDPTPDEIAEHERFLSLEYVSIEDLVKFVQVYEPEAQLRNRSGLDVEVGNYFPPAGGPEIPRDLTAILDAANGKLWTPWEIHVDYESLHPFTDGNGRSGRVLWWWTMRLHKTANDLGFLHWFYYQTLRSQE